MLTPELLRNVRRLELRTRGLVASLFTGEYRSVFRGQGMEFAESRAYEAGDDFRSIDWNVSARMGTPYVKLFTEERELTVFLVLDRSASTDTGTRETKAALEVEVASVLALAAARQNDRVGALLFSDRIERVVAPRKGRRHALRIVRDLMAFTPAGRGTDLAMALDYTARLLRHRSIVVVLSDFVATGWERALARVAAHHDVIAVVIDDERERTLPAAGWIELEDAERGTRALVDTGSPAARARLEREAAARRERLATALHHAGAERIELVSGDDYVRLLRRAFRDRSRRRSAR